MVEMRLGGKWESNPAGDDGDRSPKTKAVTGFRTPKKAIRGRSFFLLADGSYTMTTAQEP